MCYRPEYDQAQILEKNQGFNKLNRNSDCLLLGELNFRQIDWLRGEGTSKLEESFTDTLKDNFLVQMIAMQDLVCISDPSCIAKLDVDESLTLTMPIIKPSRCY